MFMIMIVVGMALGVFTGMLMAVWACLDKWVSNDTWEFGHGLITGMMLVAVLILGTGWLIGFIPFAWSHL